MPLKLVNRADTYEYRPEIKDEPESQWPVFKLRRLAAEEVNRIEDKLFVSKGGNENEFGYLTGTGARMKLEACVVGWENVFDAGGKPVEFTKKLLGDLPAWMQGTLIEHINEENGLMKGDARAVHEKNSNGRQN